MKPNDARIHHNLGINRKRAGKLDDALSHYKSAMEIEPDNSVFLYNMGCLYNLSNEHDQAVETLQKSIHLNADNLHAQLALGDSLEKAGDEKGAMDIYKRLDPKSVKGLKERIDAIVNG